MRLGVVLLGMGLAAGGLAVTPSFAAGDAQIYLVQGLPGQLLDIAVDGKTVAEDLKSGTVSKAIEVTAGKHEVEASADGKTVTSGTVSVGADSQWDVVVHLPARPRTKPVITAYKDDLSAVSSDKASLTVAHTAAVPPADIRVNGKVLFEDVANGESLNLVVPVATYAVDIVPTGKKSPVYLGPLKLTVQGGSLNRVYAVGDPSSKSMNVAVHVLQVNEKTSSKKPDKVDTGTGGQAAGAPGSLQVDLVR